MRCVPSSPIWPSIGMALRAHRITRSTPWCSLTRSCCSPFGRYRGRGTRKETPQAPDRPDPDGGQAGVFGTQRAPLAACCLLHGSGLRLMECIRLRVQDLDFAHRAVIPGGEKGRDPQARHLSHDAPPLRHPPAGMGNGHQNGASVTRMCGLYADLPPPGHLWRCGGDQPAE